MHIPRSDAKRRYVAALKRIAKVLVIIEPVRAGVDAVQLFHDRSYALSWDDWASEYDLTEFVLPVGLSITAEAGNTRVAVFHSAGHPPVAPEAIA